jgi:hypothetical protein|tara:strand:+ start:28418 stop:28957 length:540 start_codon:yes stop_codon:yes gene_type:complete
MPYNNVNDLARLVTKNEVISSLANVNFDPNLITDDIIKIAEITHIEKVIGREFYEELVTQHDPTGTLTTANQTLMDDFLVRCLSWFVRFETLNDLQYNTTGTGIMENIDDFSQAVSPKQFDLIKQDVYRKATLFLQDMLDYISDENNINNYPTYKTSKYRDEDAMGDVTANKQGGIIFY